MAQAYIFYSKRNTENRLKSTKLYKKFPNFAAITGESMQQMEK